MTKVEILLAVDLFIVKNGVSFSSSFIKDFYNNLFIYFTEVDGHSIDYNSLNSHLRSIYVERGLSEFNLFKKIMSYLGTFAIL